MADPGFPRGAPIPIWPNFPENRMKMKEIGQGQEAHPWPLPLDPLMVKGISH